MSDIHDAPNGAPPPPYAEPASMGTGPTAEERQWGMFAHLSALVGFIIPLGNIVGPLIIWLMKKDTSRFIDDQGKESLNFQITVTIAAMIAAVLIVILVGFLLLPLIAIVALIFTIMGAIKANEGMEYRYPFALRLIK